LLEQRETPARPGAALPGESPVPGATVPTESPIPTTIADGLDKRIDPRAVEVQRIGGSIAAAVVALATLIGVLSALLAATNTMIQGLLWLGAWILVSAASGLMALLWPPVRYRHISYRVDDKGIQIRKGVWWKSTVSVPHSRVQHTDVQQGPIERSFGLATLIIHTAGTQHAAIPLSGLSHDIALGIRDHLLEDEDPRSDV